MGTFAEIFTDGKSTVPASRMKEFSERIETIFQAGGMMEVFGF